MDRREFMGLLALGSAISLSACAPAPLSTPSASPVDTGSATPSPSDSVSPAVTPTPKLTGQPGPIPSVHPGPPNVLYGGSSSGSQVALTIDDGYNADVVAAYVAFAQRTGFAITFSPNGCYDGIWDQHAAALRPLIAAGQVQIGNHTYSHLKITRRPATAVAADIERNDDWIKRTFGVTSRPYLRPPYGERDSASDELAAGLGYTSILMWNGSFGDSTVQRPTTIMNLARRYLRSGTVMLGHANHPAIVPLLPLIEDLIKARGLKPVTLDTMFGTSRHTG